MSDVERMSGRCDNCGTERTDAFCGHCGQKARPRNPTSHDILHELTHEMLHVDGRIFRSVRELLTGPGLLTLEYFEGRRVRWVSPIRLYLIFSVAYFVLASAAATRVVHVVGSVDTDSRFRKRRRATRGDHRCWNAVGTTRFVCSGPDVCLDGRKGVAAHGPPLSASSIFRPTPPRCVVCGSGRRCRRAICGAYA
jgi:hypothetical protein